MKFSVVMPIHNEEELLAYSLPSILNLEPDETILIFDRCEDRSVAMAKKTSALLGDTKKIKIIELNEPSTGWKFRIAFLRRHGYRIAKNDVILNSDADTILDPKTKTHLNLIGKNGIGLLSFSRKDYPVTVQSAIAKLVKIIVARIGFARVRYFSMRARRARGIYAFSKKAWLETEDQDSAKKITRYEDAHLSQSISTKYKTLFIKTNSVHLRPRENTKEHVKMGAANWNLRKYPLLLVIPHSVFYFRPLMLAGYLQARLRSND